MTSRQATNALALTTGHMAFFFIATFLLVPSFVLAHFAAITVTLLSAGFMRFAASAVGYAMRNAFQGQLAFQ